MGNGRRYSITLLGQFNNTALTTVEWTYDLRTLIPESLRDKKFLVHSSFSTESLGTDTHVGVSVSINFSQGYNKQFPSLDGGVWLGIANPVFIDTAVSEMKYYYNESECFVKMIDYPDFFPIVGKFISQGNQTFNNEDFILNLTFEELGSY